MKPDFHKLEKYGPLLLRVGMAVVFLYFGISQVLAPEDFVGWLPEEAAIVPLSSETIVFLNGIFEVIFGILLLAGLWRRLSAALLGFHLLGITYTIGWTQIGVRDLGLAIATIAVAFFERDEYSVDAWLLSKRSNAASKSHEEDEED